MCFGGPLFPRHALRTLDDDGNQMIAAVTHVGSGGSVSTLMDVNIEWEMLQDDGYNHAELDDRCSYSWSSWERYEDERQCALEEEWEQALENDIRYPLVGFYEQVKFTAGGKQECRFQGNTRNKSSFSSWRDNNIKQRNTKSSRDKHGNRRCIVKEKAALKRQCARYTCRPPLPSWF